jgi:hypothetical protein
MSGFDSTNPKWLDDAITAYARHWISSVPDSGLNLYEVIHLVRDALAAGEFQFVYYQDTGIVSARPLGGLH